MLTEQAILKALGYGIFFVLMAVASLEMTQAVVILNSITSMVIR
jgi:hypothetical protein